jgi:hypothetical protein
MTKSSKHTDQEIELTTEQAAEIARKDARTVRRWCASGDLPARVQILGKTYLYFIKPSDLQSLLKARGQSDN